MIDAGKAVLRARLPRVHRVAGKWRARLVWGWNRWIRPADESDAYSQEFWDFHDDGNWRAFAAAILDAFQPKVVVDVGCGDGKLLGAITAVAPNVEARGFDSSPTALMRARRRGVAVEECDLALSWRREPGRLEAAIAASDVVTCLETAEHLPPWSARSLVRALAFAPVVVFSAAHPGQGGHLHINERPATYWAQLFERAGMTRHPQEAALRSRLRAIALPSWYATNLQVFHRP